MDNIVEFEQVFDNYIPQAEGNLIVRDICILFLNLSFSKRTNNFYFENELFAGNKYNSVSTPKSGQLQIHHNKPILLLCLSFNSLFHIPQS